MTRRIVDLKDVNTQELVYPATHSDAVLMPDGKTVTEAIANAGGGGGGSSLGSNHIEVTISGEYELRKNVANVVKFNLVDYDYENSCSFAFVDAPSYDDIMAGDWAEYKLYLNYTGIAIAFNVEGVIWGESCGNPVLESGYIYEMSFVPFTDNGTLKWLGVWARTTEKDIITIEFTTEYNYDEYVCYLNASAPVGSTLLFMFDNGMVLKMEEGETFATFTSSYPINMPAIHTEDYQAGDVVSDDYYIYKLVDKS